MPSPKELAKALAYRGEIRNTPQNSFLGGVANFLAPVSEFADRDKLPESIPLLGGMSFADLSGLKGSQSLIDDMSYGKSPVRGATLNTVKVDPRLLDLAAVSGAMIPVGKALGKAALREGAKQVQNRTGIARYMPDTRMGVVPEGPSIPQRPKLQVKPPKEDIYSVADANFSMGIPSGNKTVKIGTLQGSMSSAAGDAERVKKLAGQMSADGGYIERLIVDQNGNVIEGQHRLNALRSLGVTDIPVSVIQDASPTYDLLMKSGKLRSEHARQIVQDSADMLKSEGGDVSAVLSGYDLPKGYEQYFMDAVNDLSKPKAKAMSAPDNVGGAMMQRPKTEFEILHDTAQRNAALPVEQGGLGLPSGNTGMDRAAAMGFDTPAYHGTTTEIDPSFNLDYSGANALDYGKKNIWATDNPELASQYAEASLSRNQAEAIQKLGDFNWTKKEEIPDKIADAMFKDIAEYGSIEGGGANVLPLLLRGKQSVHESYGGRFKNEMPKALWGRDLENADIAVIKNVIDNPTLQKVDPSTVYAIKNPANIRSRFAAFDPMRRHEADILAGVGVGGMLDPQAIAEALRQQDRK